MKQILLALRVLLPAVWAIRLHWVQLAMLGLSAASTGLGILGGNEAAKNAKDSAKHDAELIRAATEAQVDSILAAKDEAQASAVNQMSEIARAAAVQRARIITAAGEAGIAGASPAKQLLGAFYQEAQAKGHEMYNLGAYKEQANRDIRAAEAGLQVNLPKYQNTQPSIGSQLFAGALEALSIYSNTR